MMFGNMDTFSFHDVRTEKANAISRYRKTQRITVLFRFVELFLFLIVVSRFSTPFTFSFRPWGEYFRGISVTLISPRFVFVVGNVIVLVLLLKSGEFSLAAHRSEGKLNRSRSENIEKSVVEQCRRVELRRNMTERCRGSVDSRLTMAAASGRAEGMSGEEFRRTVEAFIARQQRFLREEE